jgi:hypothetical protein
MSFCCPSNVTHKKIIYDRLQNAVNTLPQIGPLESQTGFSELYGNDGFYKTGSQTKWEAFTRAIDNLQDPASNPRVASKEGGVNIYLSSENNAQQSTRDYLVNLILNLRGRIAACSSAYEISFGDNLLQGYKQFFNLNGVTKFTYIVSYIVVAFLCINYYLTKIKSRSVQNSIFYGFKDGAIPWLFYGIVGITAIVNMYVLLSDQTWRAIYSFAVIFFAILILVIILLLFGSLQGIRAGINIEYIVIGFILCVASGFMGLFAKMAVDRVNEDKNKIGKHTYSARKYSALILIPLIIPLILIGISFAPKINKKLMRGYAVLSFFCALFGLYISFWKESAVNINNLVESQSPFLKKYIKDNTLALIVTICLVCAIFFVISIACRVVSEKNESFDVLRSLFGAILLGLIYAFNLTLAVIAPFILIILGLFEKLMIGSIIKTDNTWAPFGTMLLDMLCLVMDKNYYNAVGATNKNLFMNDNKQ